VSRALQAMPTAAGVLSDILPNSSTKVGVAAAIAICRCWQSAHLDRADQWP